MRGGEDSLEKMLIRVFAEADRLKPANIFEPPGHREGKAKALGIDERSDLQRIVDATRSNPNVFIHLHWVRERLLAEARSGKKESEAKVRAWLYIVLAHSLYKSLWHGKLRE